MVSTQHAKPRIIDSRHPNFLTHYGDWQKWRDCYRGGEEFRDRYLEQFSNRESTEDFKSRKSLTPIPGFAKAAVNDIRNAIFQRLADVVRKDGSAAYQAAIQGEGMGVDLRGSTMNYFLGNKCLTELLVMGKCGVYVDAPEVSGVQTMADSLTARPYLYHYAAEDILNFSAANPENPSEFQSVLLRDTVMSYDPVTWLPIDFFERLRLVWLNQETGKVNIQFFDVNGNEVDRNGNPGGPVELKLTRIPFVLLDIGDSVMKDVCQHQIALLNLVSSDVNYALKANFPFYVEQRDSRGGGTHLKRVATDGSAQAGGQGADIEDAKIGPTQGRYYDPKMDQPAFIAPPSEPLQASMRLQEKLENDVRKLVNLAVTNLGGRLSAESKAMDNQGLEAGLSFIGLVLEHGERRITDFWSTYEEERPARRNVASIKYPDRYSLKTDSDRIEEAKQLVELMFAVPGRTIKRELSKSVVSVLLAGKTKAATMRTIFNEIEQAKYTTSDPDTIIKSNEAGLVGDQTASMALGFDEDEYLQARDDHMERVKRLAEAQGMTGDSANRGVDDLSADPANSGSDEKAIQRQTTDLNDSKQAPVRGEGQ